MDWCGTVDLRIKLLELVFLIALPIILLYLLGNYIYCKVTGRVFLETEGRELEEAKRHPPTIDL